MIIRNEKCRNQNAWCSSLSHPMSGESHSCCCGSSSSPTLSSAQSVPHAQQQTCLIARVVLRSGSGRNTPQTPCFQLLNTLWIWERSLNDIECANRMNHSSRKLQVYRHRVSDEEYVAVVDRPGEEGLSRTTLPRGPRSFGPLQVILLIWLLSAILAIPTAIRIDYETNISLSGHRVHWCRRRY